MIKCPKDGTELGKIVGKALYLPSQIEGQVSGHYLSGQDFQVVIKCKCGEVVTVVYEKGEYKYDGYDSRLEARTTDGSGAGEGSGVGGDNPKSESGETGSTGEGEGKGSGVQTTIPPKPKSWISGK